VRFSPLSFIEDKSPFTVTVNALEGAAMIGEVDPTIINLTVFVLAVFVGYHVVWNVTPALHTPLMSVTNAISGIILVGAMLAAGPAETDWGVWLGAVAVTLAAINVFGGFLVTQRMLEMFRKKDKKGS
jgi:H+-translocating NAD(P) transhydrogenase subunit alpha